MWVIVNYYPSTSARSVYYVAKAMRTKSSYLAGYVLVLRFMSVARGSDLASSGEYNGHAQEPPRDYFGPEPASQYGSLELHDGDEFQPLRRERLDASARSPIGRTRTPIGRPIDKGG